MSAIEQIETEIERSCSKCLRTKPIDEFYELKGGRNGRMAHCRACNNKRPATESRVVNNRARNRAYAELVRRHPAEFEQILDEQRTAVLAELKELSVAASATRTRDTALPRLKPGPKRRGQTSSVDRLDVARCEQCHEFHDRDHACVACGSHPSTSEDPGRGNAYTELLWQDEALCAQIDTEIFFPEKGGSTRSAKKICNTCPVREQCLQHALDNNERYGIWGGLSERERRKLKGELDDESEAS